MSSCWAGLHINLPFRFPIQQNIKLQINSFWIVCRESNPWPKQSLTGVCYLIVSRRSSARSLTRWDATWVRFPAGWAFLKTSLCSSLSWPRAWSSSWPSEDFLQDWTASWRPAASQTPAASSSRSPWLSRRPSKQSFHWTSDQRIFFQRDRVLQQLKFKSFQSNQCGKVPHPQLWLRWSEWSTS